MEPAVRDLVRAVIDRKPLLAMLAVCALTLAMAPVYTDAMLAHDTSPKGKSRGGCDKSSNVIAQDKVLIRYTGQLLDVQKGFVFFTTGDGFRIAANARILDLKSGRDTTVKAATGMFARATFNQSSGTIVQLEISRERLPQTDAFAVIKRFAITASTPAPNPDLGEAASSAAPQFNGKPVLVTFTVQVPPSTPLTDSVYISTDQSQWNPLAIRMDRIDGLHYRITREIASGTIFRYRYTRGSFQTTERGRDGLEIMPRSVTIQNLDVKRRDDVVYHWSDESGGSQGLGPTTSLPTPFNPNPFATPRP